MERPQSIIYARNLVITNIVLVNLLVVIYPHIVFTSYLFFSIFHACVHIFFCYKFYEGEKWASIGYTIISCFGILINISIFRSIDNDDLEIISFISAVMSVAIIYFLNIKESRDWFSYKKNKKLQNDFAVKESKNIYNNYTYNTQYNYYKDNKILDINKKENKIVISCPRCYQKLRVPGNRSVIAKCSKCLLEFKTEI